MTFKSLFELLDEAPVTLVLGAGSSCDCGLPTWGKLASQVMRLSQTHASSLYISKEVANFWAGKLEKIAMG